MIQTKCFSDYLKVTETPFFKGDWTQWQAKEILMPKHCNSNRDEWNNGQSLSGLVMVKSSKQWLGTVTPDSTSIGSSMAL